MNRLYRLVVNYLMPAGIMVILLFCVQVYLHRYSAVFPKRHQHHYGTPIYDTLKSLKSTSK